MILRILKHSATVCIDCCNRQGCTTKGRLKFIRWRIIFVSPQFGTCFMSSFWSPEFGGDSWIFRKSVQFCCWLNKTCCFPFDTDRRIYVTRATFRVKNDLFPPKPKQSNITVINPLNAELNPICHLLALLGVATTVVVSRLRVKSQWVYCEAGTVYWNV